MEVVSKIHSNENQVTFGSLIEGAYFIDGKAMHIKIPLCTMYFDNDEEEDYNAVAIINGEAEFYHYVDTAIVTIPEQMSVEVWL